MTQDLLLTVLSHDLSKGYQMVNSIISALEKANISPSSETLYGLMFVVLHLSHRLGDGLTKEQSDQAFFGLMRIVYDMHHRLEEEIAKREAAQQEIEATKAPS